MTTEFRRSALVFGLVFSLWAGARGAGSFSREARGTSSALFLKLPVSARSSGLGGAVTALEGEAECLAWNPAGLGSVRERKALLSHSPYLEETVFSNGIYAQSFRGGGAAAGISYFDAGTIDQTESVAGEAVGTYHPVDWSASVGYGRKWGGWSVGAAGKFVSTRVVESDETWAVDLGILSPGFWGRRLSVGAVAKNLGGRLALAGTARPLPVEFRVGAAARPFSSWLVTGDLAFPRDNDPSLSVGTEGVWSPKSGWNLAARAGWSGAVDGDLGAPAGATVGAGISVFDVTVDYAFSPVNDLGDAHRFSLGYTF